MSIDYSTIKGWPIEKWDADGFHAETHLLCAWDDREALIFELAADGGQVYPYMPGTLARVVAASSAPYGVKPDHPPGELAGYDEAEITVRYSTKLYEYLGGSVFVSEAIEPNGEFITVPHEDGSGQPLLYWDASQNTPIAAEESPGKRIPGFDYLPTFHRVVVIPLSADSLVDYCNNANVASYTLGRVFAAETLLYAGYTSVRDISPGGAATWRVTCRFSYRPVGWNTFWRPGYGWSYMYNADGSRYYNHPLGNLGSII